MKCSILINLTRIRFIETIFLPASSRCPYHLALNNNKVKSDIPVKGPALLLDDLNKFFLSQHKSTSQLKIKNIDTVLVYLGNNLTLWKKNKEQQFEQAGSFITPGSHSRYTRLKQISHIPLIIQSLIKEYSAGKLQQEALEIQVKKLLETIEEILKSINDVFAERDVQKQIILLKQTTLLLDWLLMHPDSPPLSIKQQFNAYLLEIEDALKQNIAAGAEAQIEELDKQISEWGLKDEAVLNKSRVIIVGPHGPRKGRVDIQYYMQLYHQICRLPLNELKDNLIYNLEMLPRQIAEIDIAKDLIEDFLMGSEFNKSIGKKVLKNRFGMFRDILESDGPAAIHKVLQSGMMK